MSKTPFWTEEEINVIRGVAERNGTVHDAKKYLISRSIDAIHNKASALGLSLAGGKPQVDFAGFREFMKNARKVKCL